MSLFVSAFFHLAWCSQGSFMSQQESVFHSFSWLGNIPLCGYTTISLSILLLQDIWVVSTFRLLWIELLWSLVYKYLGTCFLFFGGHKPRREIAGSYGYCVLTFWGTGKLFSTAAAAILHAYQLCTGSSPLYILADTIIFLSFDYNHPSGWNVVPLRFSSAFFEWLVTLSIFSCVCRPLLYPLWRNVYSSFCPFLNWVLCLFVVEL